MNDNGIKKYSSEQYVDSIISSFKESIYTSELYEVVSDGINDTIITVGVDILADDIIKYTYDSSVGGEFTVQKISTGDITLVPVNTNPNGGIITVDLTAETDYKYILPSNFTVEIVRRKNIQKLQELVYSVKNTLDSFIKYNTNGNEEIRELTLTSSNGKKFNLSIDENGYLITTEITE